MRELRSYVALIKYSILWHFLSSLCHPVQCHMPAINTSSSASRCPQLASFRYMISFRYSTKFIVILFGIMSGNSKYLAVGRSVVPSPRCPLSSNCCSFHTFEVMWRFILAKVYILYTAQRVLTNCYSRFYYFKIAQISRSSVITLQRFGSCLFYKNFTTLSSLIASGTSRCLFSDIYTKHINIVWAERTIVEC